MINKYFHKYLKVAPFSLALWRSVEAQKISEVYKNLIFNSPLLDLGCGFGEFAGVFFDKQVEVGIDINMEDLIRAKKTNKHKQLFMADARNLPFPQNKFATVISNSAIEHIPHPEKVIKEVYRVLKPGGVFIYTVPTVELNKNLFYPELFRKIGLKRLRSLYIKYYHKVFKHVNIFPVDKWTNITKRAGFEIVSCKGIFSRKLVMMFDFFLMTALPSQIGRWFLGDRWIWGLSQKQVILDSLFQKAANDKNITQSNILLIAQKRGSRN